MVMDMANKVLKEESDFIRKFGLEAIKAGVPIEDAARLATEVVLANRWSEFMTAAFADWFNSRQG